MSQFAFLQREWADIYDAAVRAEAAAHRDPRTSCFYARRALELAVSWAFKYDPALKLPYQDNLSALVHEPTFKQAASEAVFSKARVINTLGNRAVHGHQRVPPDDAVAAVRELFHVCYWLAHTYARAGKPSSSLTFDPSKLPTPGPSPTKSAEQLAQLQASLRERDEQLAVVLADRASLDDELKRLRAEVAQARAAAAAQPDTHDYSEAETRDYFIDLLLKEAGLAARSASRSRVRDRRHAEQGRQRLRGLRALGRRREDAGAGRGEAHASGFARRSAAGQALCGRPGKAVRSASGHLLLEWLRALAVGRRGLSAESGAGLL